MCASPASCSLVRKPYAGTCGVSTQSSALRTGTVRFEPGHRAGERSRKTSIRANIEGAGVEIRSELPAGLFFAWYTDRPDGTPRADVRGRLATTPAKPR